MPTEGSTPGDQPIVAVVGPTATGKSELALRLAETLRGEVVNADAMQLYRGMDIGTAKLTPEARRGIPHHQLDVLDVTQEASVATYQREARADVAAIGSRGNLPILVGGSGLYVRAALDRLEIPPTDPQVRGEWERRADAEGTTALYAVLLASDPAAAARIEPNNTRRIVRALEVIELTGRPFSATMPTRELFAPALVVGLRVERDVLDSRIADRVDAMWRDGLIDEVRLLAWRGLREGRTASTAIGYAQALSEIEGALSPEAARQETTQATRRFARRQESWFRPDPRIRWFDVTEPEPGWSRAVVAVTAALADGGEWPA